METLEKISKTVKQVVDLKKEFDSVKNNQPLDHKKLGELKNSYSELRKSIESDNDLNEHMVMPKELHEVELWSKHHT